MQLKLTGKMYIQDKLTDFIKQKHASPGDRGERADTFPQENRLIGFIHGKNKIQGLGQAASYNLEMN